MASDGPEVPLGSSEDMDRRALIQRIDTEGPKGEVPANQNNHILTQETTAESTGQLEEGADVCQYFLVGKCHFGHRCRLSHSIPTPEDREAVLIEQEGRNDGEKESKHKKKKGKVNKTQMPNDTERKEPTKKPCMRTADDVISRILWDPSAEAGDFVVGYVDRFLGVLERPFSEFNWDADPCDCDYSAELALPRHRIQYFTHRGRRVWDRNSRMDRVFGSTGQPLAPPFGGEEEVEDTEQDAEQQEPVNNQESTEEEAAAITVQEEGEKNESLQITHVENRHLKDKEQSETTVHTPESTRQGLTDMSDTGTTPRGQQETGRESEPFEDEAINKSDSRLVAVTDQISLSQREGKTGEEEGENQEEWKESWDGEDYKQHSPVPDGQSVPQDQRVERGGCRPSNRRPTHFITFRANTPSILSSFQRLQEQLISLLPSSASHWLAPPTLHVTMCLLVLHSPAEVAAAGEILRRFAHLDRNPPVAVSFPLKLKHFNGRVLYLSPQPQLHIQQLNSGLQEAYRQQGWLHRHSFTPRYHLTLAKVEGGEGERVFEGVGELNVGKGVNFGRLPVNTLHLCAMGMSKKEDGFYETVCTVTLR